MSEMNHKLKETGRSIFKAFNTGISYFLPVIICYSHSLYLQVILRMVQSFQVTNSGKMYIA